MFHHTVASALDNQRSRLCSIIKSLLGLLFLFTLTFSPKLFMSSCNLQYHSGVLFFYILQSFYSLNTSPMTINTIYAKVEGSAE